MANTMTISDFLSGISPLLTGEAIQYVCAKRGVEKDALYSSLDEENADLLEGTAYYWLSNLPVGGSTEKVSDGGFSHSEGGWTVSKANIEEWLRKYRALYSKWNATSLSTSQVRLINF